VVIAHDEESRKYNTGVNANVDADVEGGCSK